MDMSVNRWSKISARSRQQALVDKFVAAQDNPLMLPTTQGIDTAQRAWNSYFTRHFRDQPINSSACLWGFEQWAKRHYLHLIRASPFDTLSGPDSIIKSHLSVLLNSARIIMAAVENHTSVSASDFYTANAEILRPYLQSVHKELHAETFNLNSQSWERRFNEDMALLDVLPPTVTTRVSEFIPSIVKLIKQLLKRGYAYHSTDRSVYFNVASYEAGGHDLAQVQSRSDSQCEEPHGETPKFEKKGNRDFVLWAASKSDEPSWDSPWGWGRPGRNVECFAICSDVLGERIDILSGGMDLKFICQHKEITQNSAHCSGSEIVDGRKQRASYLFQIGKLQTDNINMSQSYGNPISLCSTLSKYDLTPRTLRIMFLQFGWGDPIDIRGEIVVKAKIWESVITKFLIRTKDLEMAEFEEHQKNPDKTLYQRWNDDEKKLFLELDTARSLLHAALCDNFNTKKAMHILLRLVKEADLYILNHGLSPAVKEVSVWVTRTITTFGITSIISSKLDVAMPFILTLRTFRSQVRHLALNPPIADNKSPTEVPSLNEALISLCDRIRITDLPRLGISLDEGSEPQLGEIRAIDNESIRLQRLQREIKKRQEIKKARKEGLLGWDDPAEMFRNSKKWTEWDENGLPLRDSLGRKIEGKRRAVLMKAMDKRKRKIERMIMDGKIQRPEK